MHIEKSIPTESETLSEGVIIGNKLYPAWNNEACSVCQNNHKLGKVVHLCPVIYKGSCLVEQINLKINLKGRIFLYPSLAYDTIKEYFPELKLTNNYGTTEVYIHHFKKWFCFQKDWKGQFYIRL